MKKIFKVLLAAPLALSFLLVGTACDYEITKRPGSKTSITGDSGEIVIGNWIAVEKSSFEYNETGKISTDIHYSWNMNTYSWVESYKTYYEYNDKGDVILQINYRWDEWTCQWIGESKFENDDENKTHIHYYWANELNDWRISQKQVSVWDGDFPTREEIYRWSYDTNDWILTQRGRYEYDDREATSLIEWSQYDEYTQEWFYNNKTEIEYSEDWKTWTHTNYWYSREKNDWDKQGKYIMEYNDYDVTSQIDYRWSESDESWIETGKSTYEYNKNQKRILEIHYDWSEETDSFVEREKIVFDYNEDGEKKTFVRFILQEI